jgi:biopolymer transport protein ExbD
MSLLPDDQLKSKSNFNFAPMIDFLFLMLAFFAILAVSRASLYDTKLNLVQLKSEENKAPIQKKDDDFQINLSVTDSGSYKWITDIQTYPMESISRIKKELNHQHKIGLLPEDKSATKVLLHIDKEANWESVAKLIFAIREEGFDAFPIYELDKSLTQNEK